MNLPIRVRLTLWFAGLLAAIVLALGSFLVLQLRSDLRMAMDEEVHTSSVSVLRAFTDERRERGADIPVELAENPMTWPTRPAPACRLRVARRFSTPPAASLRTTARLRRTAPW